MKKLLLLVTAAFLMAGCTTNNFSPSNLSSSENPSSEPVSSSETPSSSSEEPVNPEPEILVKTLEEFKALPNVKTAAYYVTAKIARFKAGDTKDKYGNLTLIDGTKELKIYGSTITESALKWNGVTYSFKNPEDFMSKSDTNNLKVIDTVTMKLIRCDYTEGGNTTIQGQGVIVQIDPSSNTPQPVSEIKLNKTSATIKPNEILSLVETVMPVNAISKNVEWHSTNPTVAEVNEHGVVVGKANGSAKIYAVPANPEDEDPEFTYQECTVTVDNTISYDYNYSNYYAGLSTWSNGADLINKLHNIISYGKTSVKYDKNWATNQGADQAMDDLEMVDLVYSKDKELKTKTNDGSSGWQREHAFCASLMTGYTTDEATDVGNGRATDFHNLFASDGPANGSRNNKNLGVADVFAKSYGSKGDATFDRLNFEPNDIDKGRLTRAIFYMAVMYNQVEENIDVATKLNYDSEDVTTYGHQSTIVHLNATYEPLRIVEEDVPYKKYTYTDWYYSDKPKSSKYNSDPALQVLVNEYGKTPDGYAAYSNANCEFAIGHRSTLLKWSGINVDLSEMQHNNYVFENAQNNRNPFVDYPELINYAFGDYTDQPGSLENVKPAYNSLEMDKDEIHHYALSSAKREYDVGSTFVSSDYTVVGVKNNLTTVPATYEDQTSPYTFREEDAQNNDGKMKMNILTPINTIKLGVKVNAGTLNSCNYIGTITKPPLDKNDFVNGQDVTINSVEWNFSWTNELAVSQKITDANGVAIGQGPKDGVNYGVGELTIETTEEKTVNMTYIKANCASGKTINYTIYVGSTKVNEGTIAYNKDGAVAKGANFTTTTGKVRIVINGTGATTGAVYVQTLAFNTVTE